mgnify:FL=1
MLVASCVRLDAKGPCVRVVLLPCAHVLLPCAVRMISRASQCVACGEGQVSLGYKTAAIGRWLINWHEGHSGK